MTKTTYEKLFEAVEIINKVRIDPNPKFDWAIMRTSTRLNKLFKKYQDRIFDINLEYCEVYAEGEKKGSIIRDQTGNYTFTKEGEKAKQAAIRKLKEEEVEFEPFYAPLDLTLATQLGVGAIEAFSGIFLDPIQVEQALEAMSEQSSREIEVVTGPRLSESDIDKQENEN